MRYKIGNEWKTIIKAFYKTGGVWKEIKSGFYKDNGTWKPLLGFEEELEDHFNGEFSNVSGTSGTTEFTETRTVQFDFDLKLQITLSGTSGDVRYRINAGTWTVFSNNSVIPIDEDDTLQFRIIVGDSSESISGEVTLIDDDTDEEIDSFLINMQADCYLTTAMVHYYGKDDNGPELTAMRALRSELGNEYPHLLEDYSLYSSQIVNYINNSNQKEEWYELIKDVVLQCMEYVNQNNLIKAAELYEIMYVYLRSGSSLQEINEVIEWKLSQ